jgi:predicted amidophosphoribosyltransferase
VLTIKARGQLKGVSVDAKLDQLRGTVHVDPHAFQNKRVLIIDDLFQSGTSINYVGMLLQQAGARKMFGLACEKTLGNFDNLGTRGSA